MRAFLFFTSVGLAVACSQLPDIPESTCGNRIVDPLEDCDTYPVGTTACRPPDATSGACHLDCTKDPAHDCPRDYLCSRVKGICVRASGTFDTTSPTTVFSNTTSIAFGDFDGDGRTDTVTSAASSMRVHYFDDGFQLAKTISLSVTNPRFRIGSVGSDKRADLAVIRPIGDIDIFRGETDRSVSPTIYGTTPLPGVASARAVLLHVQGTTEEIFLFASQKNINTVSDIQGRRTDGSVPTTPPVIAITGQTPASISGEIPVAHFNEASTCDQFALVFQNALGAAVYTPCRLKGPTWVLNTVLDANNQKDPAYVLPTVVGLANAPIGTKLGYGLGIGGFAALVNADKHADLVLVATDPSNAPAVYVAYGVGDGTFHSDPMNIPASNGNNLAAPYAYPLVDASSAKPVPLAPLAIGDLDGDGQFDFVTALGIYFSIAGKYYVGPQEATTSPWSEAKIADFNRDGLLDVAAANPSGAIDFYFGNGTIAMSHLAYAVDGAPSHLSTGDYDGDLALDLSFILKGSPNAASTLDLPQADAIAVMFGTAFSYPEQPVSLGALPSIASMASGPLAATYTGSQGTTNLAVSSMIAIGSDTMGNLFGSLLIGSPDRVITSPFEVYVSTTQHGTAVRLTEGHFTNAPMDDPSRNDLLIIAGDGIDTKAGVPQAVGPYRLWLAPAQGGAQLDATVLQRQADPPLDATWDWPRAVIATVDVDGPNAPTAQALIVVPPVAKSGATALFMVKPSFALSMIGTIGGWDYTQLPNHIPNLRSSDIDGDGTLDVVVHYADATGKPALIVLWNDNAGAFTLANSASVPGPPDPAVAFTSFRPGPVAQHAVAMLTAKGVYLAKTDGTKRQFLPPVQAPGLPGGALVGAADLDGDGVADLVISHGSTVQFFRGLPLHAEATR